ncbi:GAF domain-containing protein (plasmid) [Deinococcus radiomollis]|uniref:GAF domain-containing protein n=1 Tax=Deinococcus radiomollis TaxID=468916 RepID=UPI0038914E43
MTAHSGAAPEPLASLAERLQDITEALAATTTQREVIEVVLTPAVQALGAVAGIVLLVDETDQQMKIAGSQGYEDGAPTVWQEGPIEDHVLIADILRMKKARYFEDAGALQEAYPELESRTGAVAAVANATLPMFLDEHPLGVIVLDFKEPHLFTPAERRFLTILSGQCAVALGRADATRTLRAEVEKQTHLLAERARQLEDQTRRSQDDARALEAFVAFTEAVGTRTDLVQLVQRAIRVLEVRFPGVSVAYYEQDEDLWKARVWSIDLPPELAASLAAGLPSDTPLFAEVVQTRQPVFTDAWDAEQEQIALTEEYGAVAGYPLVIEGELHSFLAVGLRETRSWSEADQALVRAVGRSLNLALERTETARELTRKNAELELNTAELLARTRALEAFAQLTRDLALTTDPLLLIQRAQEVVITMLGDGAALYYEPEGDRWHNRVQQGSLHSPELQAAIDAGLPYADTNNLLIPWTSGQPYFQDMYDRNTDQLPSLVGHIGATAALPLCVGHRPLGVMVFALFQGRTWSTEDRMLLEVAMQSLELALDRAEQTRTVTAQRDALDARTQELAASTLELQASTQELEASTQELEAFSYSVSHDLRTSVRHMLGFLTLARKSLDGRLDERSRRYLDVVGQAGEQMNTMIDAMLDLSRAMQRPLQPTTFELDALMAQLREALVPDLLSRNVEWEVAPLPAVYGDRDALHQVLTQLVENALKFTQGRDPAVIRVWAEEQGEAWKISVLDNGLGFDPRYQDRLFNLFQRLHGAQEVRGSGVGLAQVKRLIVKHGGQVFAEGQVDEGATFGFTLPKSASPRS